MAKTVSGKPNHITDRMTLSAVAETVTNLTVPAWARKIELFPEVNDIKVADAQQAIADGAATIGAKYHLVKGNSGYSLELTPGRQKALRLTISISSPVASTSVGIAVLG